MRGKGCGDAGEIILKGVGVGLMVSSSVGRIATICVASVGAVDLIATEWRATGYSPEQFTTAVYQEQVA